jgi:hypothetical protein
MYESDAPFQDPVVRCDSCQRILLVSKLREMGGCLCGSRKVRNLKGFDDKEEAQMKDWGVDPLFLRLFEPIPDKTGIGVRP